MSAHDTAVWLVADEAGPVAWYPTAAGAQAHADECYRTHAAPGGWDWVPDGDGWVQATVHPDTDRPTDLTGWTVTPMPLAQAVAAVRGEC